MLLNKEIFRSYDIRGIFGEFLTESLAESASCVFAGHVSEETGKINPKISVGRDIRFSSEALHKGVVRGLLKAGADVVDLGVCPSPLTYFSNYCTDTDGYVMITGSHNPPEFNGLKVGTKNTVYHSEKIMRIHDEIAAGKLPDPEKKGTLSRFDITEAYTDWMRKHFSELKDKTAALDKKIKIVVDCGSGTASRIAPELFRWLGADVFAIFCEPDGNFPGHHPDPTVEKNLEQAKEILIKESADFVIGYDGDADRLGALNCDGKLLRGDELLCIFADHIASAHQGKTVVADVKASQGLYEFIQNLGMNPVMYRSGHSMIKVKMKKLNAVLGGEMSSHFFFADRYFGFDDGIYASLRLFEAYVDGLISGKFISTACLTAKIPMYVNTPEIREPFGDSEKFIIVKKLKQIYEEKLKNKTDGVVSITDIDGVRIGFEKGWALVRASNTEPLLVTRYEAVTENEMKRIQKMISEELETLK